MKPERIIAKDCDGKPLVRWVLEVVSGVAYLTTTEGLASINNGITLPILGWHLVDVYQFTHDLEQAAVEWGKMTPWQSPTAPDAGLSE